MNIYDLTRKSILYIGSDSSLDLSIIKTLQNNLRCQSINNNSNIEGNTQLVEYQYKNVYDIEPDLKDLIKKHEAFDGVVFNVVHSDFRPLQFVKPDLVNTILYDNYNSFIECVRILKKNKGLNDGASIVAMSSISSIRAMKAKMAFCSAKAAMDAAIRCLAVELADNHIRINSVQKGFVDVDFEKEHIKNITAINDEKIKEKILLGVTKSLEIANLIAFLLSDATTTITGTSIVIDGGYTL